MVYFRILLKCLISLSYLHFILNYSSCEWHHLWYNNMAAALHRKGQYCVLICTGQILAQLRDSASWPQVKLFMCVQLGLCFVIFHPLSDSFDALFIPRRWLWHRLGCSVVRQSALRFPRRSRKPLGDFFMASHSGQTHCFLTRY